MTGRLAGRRALVTGASRGIGRAIAEFYAEEGADLFLVATGLPQLEEVAAAVRAKGRRAEVHAADVGDKAQAEAMAAAAAAALGGLDVLVNNAGVYKAAPFVDFEAGDFERLFRINALGTAFAMQAAIRHWSGAGTPGKIVNVASTAGKWESANQAGYNASKHAAVAITRCAALEHGKDGININAICPGFVETDMLDELNVHADLMGITPEALRAAMVSRTPIGRIMRPEDIAHVAVFLGSGESDGMTGQTITISGGMRMG
ncbi:MAG: SDR family NAD(P)-dependent oxidoreductase [Pseudomonadota bacterium]